MNNIISEVEEKTAKVKEQLHSTTSSKRALIILFEYYQFLLDINNKQITEAYLPEFVQSYTDHIENFNPYCLHPSITQQIIEQAKKIADYFSGTEIADSLVIAGEKLQGELDKFKKVLSGDIPEELVINKICFPLLEENNDKTPDVSTGILETLTIKVSKTKDENKFLLIPSEIKIESQLKNQIETSWQQAVRVAKKYARRIAEHHEVIIRFDKRVGFYRGNSLGAALTIAFIEELLSYYNSPVVITTGKGISLTGGLEKDGSLIATSEEIIGKKVENVFYSPIQTFVVPEGDLPYAETKLKTLQKEFPKRELNLIGIKTLEDLLDSRKLVDIRKQKIIVRSSKFAVSNKVAILFFMVIVTLVYFARLYDFDSNPAILVNKGTWLFVQNKNGKELWKKKVGYNSYIDYENQRNLVSQKIFDVDNDGTNEVILSLEDKNQYSPPLSYNRVACFSSSGSLVWEYVFRDSISSIEQQHSLYYVTNIIDTITIGGVKALALFANNILYPTAVFFVELSNGKRFGPTMWHVGHLHSGLIGDIDEDGNNELIMTGVNNSLGRVIIFSIDADKIGGQLPAVSDRIFLGRPIAEVNNYVLLPKSDYTSYFGLKFNRDMWGNLKLNAISKEPFFYLYEGKEPDYKGILVEFTKDLIIKKLDISEWFEVARDSLVSRGELPLPYSHTKEYLNILFEQVRYWDGERFVRKENLN
ncbi:MAG: hypothetical protein IIA49_11790 [Bacteroidetes bacterium]|nr:hypothetical protein [Bacteroidota bacterium]